MIDCIFQVQAAMNGEDIMRAKIVQQFNNVRRHSIPMDELQSYC